jgi:hypothetical protein
LWVILRGLFLMARGAKSGIKEFDNSMDAFTASLAPLIAFPLVGAGVSALSGQWQMALIGFLSRLCAVLALPLITHEFARRTGREALWLRTATALDWSFWLLVPMLFIAAVAGAILVQLGLAMESAEYVALGLMGGYLLWYHWFIVRTGLVLGRGQAAFLVVITGLTIALFTAGPFLLNYALTGSSGLPT